MTYIIGGACGGTDTETITVNQQSDATITPVDVICNQQGIITLDAAENGGTWTADCGACINASTGQFNIGLAGIGAWTVTYSVGTICPDTKTTTINIVDCLGLDETTENSISIYPNPTNSFVTITTGNLSAGIIIITDVMGREIYRYNFNSPTTLVELTSIYARGTYFVQIVNEEGTLVATKKLVKQ